ncbi:AAA-like domain-containing protein [Mastigocoleus testarum]|uniref:Uncharacterized protein n=1 Tax=Mastigocoleus testarum BC008 TaxID=371196 RepID=A0A0V8A199_9CYAN|nr:AAA-like domain-containing protein [Mastigocoleus testarum]KST70390.1 hypothetical protein BC008_45185 [Mastigocoleus testarum BC008]
MSPINLPSYKYQVGGSLPTNSPTYVKRKADDELYKSLRNGEFCYVLNSRQMGKSSLRVQTMKRLQEDNFTCVAIDITNIGTVSITQEQWYAGIIDTIINNLELYDSFDLNDWWMEQNLLSPVNKLSNFFEFVLLKLISQQIVIFIDEIDSILSLNFAVDDFFALIRECYNSRASQPDFQRLTFALLGVANPRDLIQDKRRTPFNIGKAIELTGFELDEAQPLAQGLAEKTSQSMAVMDAVLYWTGGQPFLTQKLCKLILNHQGVVPADRITEWVGELVNSEVILNWETQDEPQHLRTIRDRIMQGGGQLTGRLLGLYKQILLAPISLQKPEITPSMTVQERDGITVNSPPDQEELGENSVFNTSEEVYLRLSGLVVEQQGKLRVYNSIYQSIFNLDWVNQELKNLRPDSYGQAFEAWFNSNCDNNSYLLRGEKLGEALAWAEGKSLSNQDYQFITASQKWEFAQAQQKTQRQTLIGGVVLTASLVLAVTAGVFAGVANQQRIGAVSRLKQANSETQQANQEKQTANRQANNFKQQQLIAEKNLKIAAAKQQTTEAKVKQTQQRLTNAQQKLQQTEKAAKQQIKSAQVKVSTANKQAGEAQTRAKKAQNELKKAQLSLKEAWEARTQALKEAENAQKSTELERLGNVVLRQFEYDKTPQIVVRAMEAGHRLKALVKDRQNLDEYPATSPVRALNTVLNIPQRKTLRHEFEVNYAAFSPDSKRIVTASFDNTAKLWGVNGKLLQTLPSERDANQEHRYNIVHVAFSPNGQKIVAASSDKTAKLWDINGKLLHTLKGHQDKVFYATFSPHHQRIITVSADKTAKLWDINGKLLHTLKGHQDKVINAAFSPNGKQIVTVSWDKTAKVWDIDGKLLHTLTGHQSIVVNAAFSPNGKQIITVSWDKTAKLWDINGKLLQTLDNQKFVHDVAFSPNGKEILTASNDGTARVWDINGKILQNLTVPENEGTISTEAKRAAFVTASPGSSEGTEKQIIVASPQTTRIWGINGKLLHTLKLKQDKILHLAFSPDGKLIFTGSQDGIAQLWDINGKLIQTLTDHRYKSPSIPVAFSPDSKRIATIDRTGTVFLWDIGGKLLQTLKGGFRNVTFSPNSKYIVIISGTKARVLYLETLDELLARGCDWLEDYFVDYPEARKKTGCLAGQK